MRGRGEGRRYRVGGRGGGAGEEEGKEEVRGRG